MDDDPPLASMPTKVEDGDYEVTLHCVECGSRRILGWMEGPHYLGLSQQAR